MAQNVSNIGCILIGSKRKSTDAPSTASLPRILSATTTFTLLVVAVVCYVFMLKFPHTALWVWGGYIVFMAFVLAIELLLGRNTRG